MSDFAIRAENVRKRYRLGQRGGYRVLSEAMSSAFKTALRRGRAEADESGYVWALDGVSFEVPEGEFVGVVGRNGAGKSTLLKILSGITEPTEGRIELRGRVGALLEVGTGFHPELTGRENVYLNASILGMSRREVDRKLSDIVDFSGVSRFMDTPLKFYSSGMAVRLGFAVAAYLEPEILVVDEVLAVGDIEFQERCIGKMRDVASAGRTVLFVSHNMTAISMLCPQAMWLEAGRVLFNGATGEAIQHYVEASRGDGDTDWLEGQASRVGSGAVRITSLRIEDEHGALYDNVPSGAPVRFVLGYEATGDADLSQLTLNLVLGPSPNQGIVSFMSDVSGPGLVDAPRVGRAVCEVPELPLMPGHYNLQFSCLIGRDLADKVHQAATVVVTRGDFFGTDRLPPQAELYGPLLVRHAWHTEPVLEARPATPALGGVPPQ
jgi:lipopolysaccharide transport system ATP-binding protein